MSYQAHPAADLFPMLDDKRLQQLANDIKTAGLRHPIILHRGQILDGRNRYAACRLAGVTPRFEDAGDDINPWAYVWSLNGERRDLTADQRYLIWKRATEHGEAWQEEERRIRDEANAKRAQAAEGHRFEGNQFVSPTHSEEVVVEQVVPVLAPQDRSTNELESKPAGATHKTRKAKAAASKTNPGAVQRMDELDRDRPDLAEKVMTGELPAAAAVREMKKARKDAIRAVDVPEVSVTVVRDELPRVVEIAGHVLMHGDNRDRDIISQLPRAKLAFCDPPYNATSQEWDGDFVWEQDYLADIADVVAVTPGIGGLQAFMRRTAMPYRWSTACVIDNGMARGALGFGNWIYTAMFAHTVSLHRNAQDIFRIAIKASDKHDEHELGAKRQKPPPYLAWKFDLFTKEGDVILDPFAGSGTSVIVAHQLKRRCVAIERDWDSYCGLVARVRATVGG